MVCLRFQAVEIKQVDCKLSTLLCLNEGGTKLQIFGKKLSSSFNYYKRMT